MLAPIAIALAVILPFQGICLIGSTLLVGLAVARLVSFFVGMIFREVQVTTQSWQFDAARRVRLRAGSRIYRWIEPLIDELGAHPLFQRLMPVKRLQRCLDVRAEALPWKAEEYLAIAVMKAAAAVALIVMVVGRDQSVGAVSVLVVIAILVFFGKAITRVEKRARRRIARFKLRLPFAVDLIALMMDAGAGFRESLATVAKESQDHPVGEELSLIQQGLAHGKTLRQGLLELKERFHDEDIDDFVTAVIRGEELGTPISRIFLMLGDQMRLKRNQLVEKSIGQAQTMMSLPSFVLCIAGFLILLSPWAVSGLIHAIELSRQVRF